MSPRRKKDMKNIYKYEKLVHIQNKYNINDPSEVF